MNIVEKSVEENKWQRQKFKKSTTFTAMAIVQTLGRKPSE